MSSPSPARSPPPSPPSSPSPPAVSPSWDPQSPSPATWPPQSSQRASPRNSPEPQRSPQQNESPIQQGSPSPAATIPPDATTVINGGVSPAVVVTANNNPAASTTTNISASDSANAGLNLNKPAGDSSNSTTTIIGVVIGVVILALLGIMFGMFIRRRTAKKKNSQKDKDLQPSSSPLVNSSASDLSNPKTLSIGPYPPVQQQQQFIGQPQQYLGQPNQPYMGQPLNGFPQQGPQPGSFASSGQTVLYPVQDLAYSQPQYNMYMSVPAVAPVNVAVNMDDNPYLTKVPPVPVSLDQNPYLSGPPVTTGVIVDQNQYVQASGGYQRVQQY